MFCSKYVIMIELSLYLFQAFCCYHLQAEGSSAESIAALAKVDTVKQRMEAAYETLQVKKNPGFMCFSHMIH